MQSVALRALVERHQQLHTRGVDEGQGAQIEDQALGALDAIKRGAQRLDGDKVELAAGLHDRDSIAPLHFDGERLGAGDLDRASGSGSMPAVGRRTPRLRPVGLATCDTALSRSKTHQNHFTSGSSDSPRFRGFLRNRITARRDIGEGNVPKPHQIHFDSPARRCEIG
jgi:hypothetical protein